MYFDPLVSWLVPVVGFLSDKIKKITGTKANNTLLHACDIFILPVFIII